MPVSIFKHYTPVPIYAMESLMGSVIEIEGWGDDGGHGWAGITIIDSEFI